MTRTLAAASCLCAALLAPDASAIVKCVDKAGKVTYQDEKCPDDSKSADVRIMSSPPPEAPTAGTAGAESKGPPPSTDERLGEAEKTIAGFESCAAAYPEFLQKYSDAYDSWKRMNDRLVQRTRRNEGSIDRIKAEKDEAKAKQATYTPEQAKARLGYCEAAIPALLTRDIEKFLARPNSPS
ncbi:hypothetical protein BWI17_17585 [Betaproteobacteria bacterium GR16-43]|nr:hypothetical protein BWI17_17585 [Betaproteobacteria bacterium GR16-43]